MSGARKRYLTVDDIKDFRTPQEIVELVKPLIAAQMGTIITRLDAQDRELKESTAWKHSFYGNGTGQKGAWEQFQDKMDQRHRDNQVATERLSKDVRALVESNHAESIEQAYIKELWNRYGWVAKAVIGAIASTFTAVVLLCARILLKFYFHLHIP